MTTRKVDATLGPWTGGLNTRDEPTFLQDNELSRAENIIIQTDGTIKFRPGFYSVNTGFPAGSTFKGIQVVSGQTNPFAFIYDSAGSYGYFYGLDIRTGVWSSAFAAAPFSNIYGYMNIIHNPITNGYQFYTSQTSNDTMQYAVMNPYQPSTNVVGTGPVGRTAKPGTALVYQFRSFMAENSGINRVDYSKSTVYNNFEPPDGGYFTVSSPITAMKVYNSNLYITTVDTFYRFTFQLDPGTDGYLTPIATLRDGKDVIEVEGRIFVLDSRGLHEYANGDMLFIADRVFKEFNTLSLDRVSRVDDYLICTSGLGKAGNSCMVYNFRINCWMKWTTTSTADWSKFMPKGKIFPMPFGVFNPGDTNPSIPTNIYPEGGYISENGIYINLKNKPIDVLSDHGRSPATPTQYAYFEVRIQTKQYPFSSPVDWKKHYKTVVNNNKPFFLEGVNGEMFIHRYNLTVRNSDDHYITITNDPFDPNTEFGVVFFPRVRFLTASWGYDFTFNGPGSPPSFVNVTDEMLLLNSIYTTIGIVKTVDVGKGESIG